MTEFFTWCHCIRSLNKNEMRFIPVLLSNPSHVWPTVVEYVLYARLSVWHMVWIILTWSSSWNNLCSYFLFFILELSEWKSCGYWRGWGHTSLILQYTSLDFSRGRGEVSRQRANGAHCYFCCFPLANAGHKRRNRSHLLIEETTSCKGHGYKKGKAGQFCSLP